MGSGLNNLLKYSMVIDSRNGWYYGQRIAIGLSVALIVYISRSTNSGSKGLELISLLFYSTLILSTFACISIFSSAVTNDKENGTLPLVMMTGAKPWSYISSKFTTKFFQLLSLLLIMVPPTFLGITLGGVTVTQVVDLYIYLIVWLFFIGAISLWPSVLFQSKQEATIISIIFVSIFLIITVFTEYSALNRFSQIASNTPKSVYSFNEIYIYFFISLIILCSAAKNLHFGILFPISFIDDYFERVKIKRFKGQIDNYQGEKIIIRTPRVLPIMAKDKYLIPYKKMFSENVAINVNIGALLFLTFPFGFGLCLLWLLITPLLMTWKRTIEVFYLELENQTFTSLMALPTSNEELFEAKIQSACIFPHKVPYFLIFVPLGFASVVTFSLSLALMVIFMPFLFRSLVYLTSLVTFKTREMTKVTTFTLCLIAILAYYSIPFIAPLSYFSMKHLKKLNIKELDKLGEISD